MTCVNRGNITLVTNGYNIDLRLIDGVFLMRQGVPTNFVGSHLPGGATQLRQVREQTITGFGRDIQKPLQRLTSKSETIEKQIAAITQLHGTADQTFSFLADGTCTNGSSNL
jgi:hypothetical protein